MKYLSILFLLALTSCGGNMDKTVVVAQNHEEPVAETVFSQGKLIYETHRKSVFRLSNTCEMDLDGDGIFGEVGDDDYNILNDDGSIYDTISTFSNYGTGWLMSNDTIATNKHVLSDETCDDTAKRYIDSSVTARIKSVQIVGLLGSSDSLYNGLVLNLTRAYVEPNISHHPIYDLTKIRIDDTEFLAFRTPFQIDNTIAVETLTPTLSMSYPLGITDLMSNIGGISSNGVTYFNGYDFYTSNDTDRGSSGSPIVNIDTGKAIGLVTAGFANSIMNPAIVIHAARLNEF